MFSVNLDIGATCVTSACQCSAVTGPVNITVGAFSTASATQCRYITVSVDITVGVVIGNSAVSAVILLLVLHCFHRNCTSLGLYDRIPGCTRLEVPKKTTDQIQPLDVFFNRQMKVILRRLYDRVLLDELDINMSERNNIIRLMSLTHNQLCSEVFRPMIQYAWYASGYMVNHLGPFQTVPDVCFSFNAAICVVSPCDAAPFICCRWCKKPLCFSHFFLNYHFH